MLGSASTTAGLDKGFFITMPNHIKNRIELIGSPEDIKSLLEKFSTFYPSEQNRSCDNELTFEMDGEFGWFDENTTIFTRRGKPSVLGIPEGFIPSMKDEWTRFPDFEKVFEVPEVIKLVGDSVSSNIIDAVHAKYNHPFSTNALLANLQSANRLRNENIIKPEDELQFERACKAYEETGYAYWYDFNSDKWGTKWNAYSCEKILENVFTFETAWSNVNNIIREMSLSFDGNIMYSYADEDTGYNVGSYLFCKGLILSNFHPEGGSKEAYEIAFDLRPDNKEYYILVDGNYQYKEED